MESWFDRAQTAWMATVPPPPEGLDKRLQNPEPKPQQAAVHLLHPLEGVVVLAPLPRTRRVTQHRISNADFAAMREGRPFAMPGAAAGSTDHAGYPAPVTQKAPPEPVAKAAKVARIELPGTGQQAVPQKAPWQKAIPNLPQSNTWPKAVPKVPPVASRLLDDRLRHIALRGFSELEVRDDVQISNPTSRDGQPMNLNTASTGSTGICGAWQ